MNVRGIMTEHPSCISPSTAVGEAAARMRDLDCGALPVCDNDELVGIVTDRDLVIRHLAEGRQGGEIRSVMTRDPFTIDADAPLERAEALMVQHQIRRLPVVENGRLVGMLSQADLARHASHEQAGTLLEAISQPVGAARR